MRDPLDSASEEFAALISGEDDDLDLARAGLLLAREHYPRLVVPRYLEKLEAMADRVDRNPGRDPIDLILSINAVLFHEFGFHGNTRAYYDPRNSFLNEVIDRRTGIPITLSVVYMEVAKRVGLRLHGVGMPGHFLVKHTDETGEVFIDPFNAGRVMDAAACSLLLKEQSGGKLALKPEYLATVTHKQILVRMLANLFGIYAQGSDYARAVWAADRILMIDPAASQYVRDRGYILEAMGRLKESASALKRYLKMAPGAQDGEEVRKHLAGLKQRGADLN